MFKYESRYLHPVRVDKPNPKYATLLQEQLGGPQGEWKAAMQYFAQSFRIKDPDIKDLFLDIAAEELGHLEMVAETINISVEKDERFAIIKIANKVPENLRYNTEDKDKKVINRIERDGLGLIIARTYLDICKASYGCNYADDNVEYWFKFRIK